MSCCGQKRHQWQSSNIKREFQNPVPEAVLEQQVAVYYHGSGSMLIEGKVTQKLYLFGDKEPVLLVDGRDIPSLLSDSQQLSLG